MGDRVVRAPAHQWLRMKRDSHPGKVEHRKIIRAITDSDNLIESNILLRRNSLD